MTLKSLQLRRGTAADHALFIGEEGEITYNSTNDSIHAHDGVTSGGFETARIDLNNVSDLVFYNKGVASGLLTYGDMPVYRTWALLNAATGAVNDMAIILTDTGTHTDPVVGGTVSNSGIFSYSASPAGWVRIANTSAADAAGFALVAEGWAEGTLPGGAGTKSAKGWAGEAEAAATEADASAAASAAAAEQAVWQALSDGIVDAMDGVIGPLRADVELLPMYNAAFLTGAFSAEIGRIIPARMSDLMTTTSPSAFYAPNGEGGYWTTTVNRSAVGSAGLMVRPTATNKIGNPTSMGDATNTDFTTSPYPDLDPAYGSNGKTLTQGANVAAVFSFDTGLSMTGGAVYAASLSVAYTGSRYLVFGVDDGGGNGYRCWIDLLTMEVAQSAAVGTGSIQTATITSEVHDFCRVSLVGSVPATIGTASVYAYLVDAAGSTTRASGSFGAWWPQLESGYRATWPVAGTVTANQEVYMQTGLLGAGFMDFIDFTLDGSYINDSGTYYVASTTDSAVSDNNVRLQITGNVLYLVVVASGVIQALLTLGSLVAGTRYRIAYAVGANYVWAQVEGNDPLTKDTAVTMPAVDRTGFGGWGTSNIANTLVRIHRFARRFGTPSDNLFRLWVEATQGWSFDDNGQWAGFDDFNRADGLMGTADSGHAWLYPPGATPPATLREPRIAGKLMVTTATVETAMATYPHLDLSGDLTRITEMRARVMWGPGSSTDQGGPALIANGNLITSSGGQVTNNACIHINWRRNRVLCGIGGVGPQGISDFNLDTIYFPYLPTDNLLYDLGWRLVTIDGVVRLQVKLPTGGWVTAIADSRWATAGGNKAIFEHYHEGTATPHPIAFKAVRAR